MTAGKRIPPVNGDEIEVRYGDEIVPLPKRLDIIEDQMRWLKLGIAAVTFILILHALGVPTDVLFPFLLELLGL